MSIKKQDKYEKDEEILATIEELEKSISPNGLILIKKIYKEICSELGTYIIAFYSDQSIIERIVKIAYKYEFDETILEYFIRTITMICRRFDINTKTSYDFLIRHINIKNKRIQFVIANQLPLLSEFDNCENKWEYILSIPKIPPKKASIDTFYRIINQQINKVPAHFRYDIIKILETHINGSNLHIVVYDYYTNLINQLKKGLF